MNPFITDLDELKNFVRLHNEREARFDKLLDELMRGAV